MESSSQLSVDYFDSEASVTEAMFPPKRVRSESTSSSLTTSMSTSSYSASVTSTSAPSSSSYTDAQENLLAPPDIDFNRIAAAVEEARKAVAIAAPFIQNDDSREVAALIEAFVKNAPIFRDAFADLAITTPSEVEVSCSRNVPEEFSIEEVSATTWALDKTTSASDSHSF